MNKILENFYKLYSLDNNICYQALIEKKDWIFRKLFVFISFDKKIEVGNDTYPELFALMDSSLIFKKLDYQKEIFGDLNLQFCLSLINKFNEDYRFINLYDHIDKTMEDGFFVELNPNIMDEKAYKELVANFYPKMSKEELELKYTEEMLEILKLAMVGNRGFCLILSKESLLNDRYYLPIFKKIYFSKYLNLDQKEAIKEISNNLGVDFYEYD